MKVLITKSRLFLYNLDYMVIFFKKIFINYKIIKINIFKVLNKISTYVHILYVQLKIFLLSTQLQIKKLFIKIKTIVLCVLDCFK